MGILLFVFEIHLFPCFWKWLMSFPDQQKIMASPFNQNYVIHKVLDFQ